MKTKGGDKPKGDAEETASVGPEETTELAERETAEAPRGERRDMPRRAERLGKTLRPSRANPRGKAFKVLRAWPGVSVDQVVVLHPIRGRRLVAGGFVQEVRNA